MAGEPQGEGLDPRPFHLSRQPTCLWTHGRRSTKTPGGRDDGDAPTEQTERAEPAGRGDRGPSGTRGTDTAGSSPAVPEDGTRDGRGTRRARSPYPPREVGTPCPQPRRSRSPGWKPPESGHRGSNGPDGVAPRRGRDSALRREEIPTPATTRMRLENMVVRETSPSQDTSCVTPVLRGP